MVLTKQEKRMGEDNNNTIIFSAGYAKPSKGKLRFLEGKIVKADYSYSISGDCQFIFTYEGGKKIKISASDLGFDIYKLH